MVIIFGVLLFMMTTRKLDTLGVFQPKKRRKNEINEEKLLSLPSKTTAFKFSDNLITDDLLMEFLIRLRICRSVIQCSTVSKRWFNLISDLQFIRFFIHHRHKQALLDYDSHLPQPYTLLLQSKETETVRGDRKSYRFYPIFSKESKILHGKSSIPTYLNFLPASSYKVLASCNDLLLVSSSELSSTTLYICNPLTRKWLALPGAPRMSRYDKFALVCDLCSCSKGLGCTNNVQYKFKVVLFDLFNQRFVSKDNYEFDTAIFCSEIGKWTNSVVSTPRKLSWAWSSAVVASDGMLLWIEGRNIIPNQVVVFYPFSCTDAKRWRFIDLPSDLGHSWRSHIDKLCLGVCQGRLQMSQLFKLTTHDFHLKIWELRGFDSNGEALAPAWWLVHKTSLRSIGVNEMCVLSFDPNDSDIIFLLCDFHVWRCKISTISKDESECFVELPGRIQRLSVFLLLHPPWPTPVPSLQP